MNRAAVEPLILAINPGNSSTKVAVFSEQRNVFTKNIEHSAQVLAGFPKLLDQLEMRSQSVFSVLAHIEPPVEKVQAVVGRGGLLQPLRSGTYQVCETMLNDLRVAARGEHASNLGAFLALAFSKQLGGCPAFVVDPVAVDELAPIARVTGLKNIQRQSLSHALNMKAVAKRYARNQGVPYSSLRLIVVHLGSGTSLSAHEMGCMIDIVNPKDEGPLSADRAGSLPSSALVDLCFSAGASAAEIKKLLFGGSGLLSLLGTADLREVISRIGAGDSEAAFVLDAMCYQVSKSVGALATVLEGRVDAILLTGGMCHCLEVNEAIKKRVRWIAPVEVFPGEDELQALAEGALRALRGEEPVHTYLSLNP